MKRCSLMLWVRVRFSKQSQRRKFAVSAVESSNEYQTKGQFCVWIFEKSFYFRIIYSPRTLLPLEAWVSRTPYRVRLFNRACLLLDSYHFGLFCPQAAWCAVQLDILVVWSLHHRVWDYTPTGDLDALASYLLAIGFHQSHNGYRIRVYSDRAGVISASSPCSP